MVLLSRPFYPWAYMPCCLFSDNQQFFWARPRLAVLSLFTVWCLRPPMRFGIPPPSTRRSPLGHEAIHTDLTHTPVSQAYGHCHKP